MKSMKNKLLLSLLCAFSLTTHNKLNAMSPLSIIAISEAITHGASASGAMSGAAMTAALVGPGLMRFGIAEAAILTNIAISLRIKKDTALIKRGLTQLTDMAKTEFADVKTKLETIRTAAISNAIRNSAEHKLTQDGIASLHQNTQSLKESVKIGFANQSSQLKAVEINLARQIRALESKLRNGVATKTDIRHLMFLQQRHTILQNKKMDEMLARMKTLEENQNTGNSGISKLTQLFRTK